MRTRPKPRAAFYPSTRFHAIMIQRIEGREIKEAKTTRLASNFEVNLPSLAA
jgi:hypothetical protein